MVDDECTNRLQSCAGINTGTRLSEDNQGYMFYKKSHCLCISTLPNQTRPGLRHARLSARHEFPSLRFLYIDGLAADANIAWISFRACEEAPPAFITAGPAQLEKQLIEFFDTLTEGVGPYFQRHRNIVRNWCSVHCLRQEQHEDSRKKGAERGGRCPHRGTRVGGCERR